MNTSHFSGSCHCVLSAGFDEPGELLNDFGTHADSFHFCVKRRVKKLKEGGSNGRHRRSSGRKEKEHHLKRKKTKTLCSCRAAAIQEHN